MVQMLHFAIIPTSPRHCSLSEDWPSYVLQNANMELPDLPNENFVAAWRAKASLTQEQLAEKIGTTAGVISLLEGGKRQLSPKWLRRIAGALEIPIGYLLEHHPDNVPEDILTVWAEVPEAKRQDALNVLKAFRRTGTEG